MVRIARERIGDLFALAEREAERPDGTFANRYVQLARRVGTRYNVRLPAEYRELYCRGCSAFWVEGRTVRTRLRGSGRVRTCLACGRVRRTPITSRPSHSALPEGFVSSSLRKAEVLVGPVGDEDDEPGDEGDSEEE
jgi:ribonuclease P protein subunit RPR2